ncbi:MAG: MarR family transcriptional regulator [Anaerolineae bacterium]|jgi:DNA-binding MarR family transcriptional regulator
MDEHVVMLERLLLRATLLELGRIDQENGPLTLSQFFALLAAQRHETGCTMSDLAAETLLPPSTATSVVDRLVELGLVERLRDEAGDRRQVLVRPTLAGEALLERVRQKRREDVAQALPSDADLVSLTELLRRYVAGLAEMIYPDGHHPPRLMI